MTPEHTALVARLENSAFSPASPAGKVEREAAAAIRALAGEVERLKLHYKGVPHDWVAQELHDDLMVENATLKADPLHTMLMAQATHRLGEIQRLEAEVAALKEDNDAKDIEWRLQEALKDKALADRDRWMNRACAALALVPNETLVADLREGVNDIAALRAERDEWKDSCTAANMVRDNLARERDALRAEVAALLKDKAIRAGTFDALADKQQDHQQPISSAEETAAVKAALSNGPPSDEERAMIERGLL